MRPSEPHRDYAPDAFSSVIGNQRGRIRKKARRRQPGEPRPLDSIAGDCLRRPHDPAVITALVLELRAHWGSKLGTRAVDEPLGRYAVASLGAGATAALRAPPPRKRRASDAMASNEDAHRQGLGFALAEVRLLYAEVAGDNAEPSSKVLTSRGRAKGVLRGEALRRHGEQLERDRELVADAARIAGRASHRDANPTS